MENQRPTNRNRSISFPFVGHVDGQGSSAESLPPADLTFSVQVETDMRQVHRQITRLLQIYKDEKRGPTMVAVQSPLDAATLVGQVRTSWAVSPLTSDRRLTDEVMTTR